MSPAPRGGDAPSHEEIKRDLLAKIHSGRFTGRLPDDAELARFYRVDVSTVRRALDELTASAVLTRGPGGGAHIARPRERALRAVRFVLHDPLPGEPVPIASDYPIVHEIMAGVADGARRHGVAFDLISADYYHGRTFAERLRAIPSNEGIVILGLGPICVAARAVGLHAVSCGARPESPAGVHHVTYDYRKAVDLGMRRLLEAGARDIAVLVSQSLRDGANAAKVARAKQTAREFGVTIPTERVVEVSYEVGLSALQVRDYLRRHELPDAFFCTTDGVAAGALKAMADLGVPVPGDVMVMGYGDFPMARHQTPPLSSVRVPRREMGLRAVDVLVDVVQADPPAEPVLVVLEPELAARETTRPVAVGDGDRMEPS